MHFRVLWQNRVVLYSLIESKGIYFWFNMRPVLCRRCYFLNRRNNEKSTSCFLYGVFRVMSMKLFVGNLPWAATEDSLKSFFEQVGEVVSVKIITDPYTGKSRGFAFVEMKSQEQGQEAMNKLNEVLFLDRSIRVSEARQDGGRDQQGGAGGFRQPRPPRRDNNRGGERRSFGRSSERSYGNRDDE